jgi:hypothetical protein
VPEPLNFDVPAIKIDRNVALKKQDLRRIGGDYER